MSNYFEFNGHKSSEYGLIVNGVNIFGAPARIVDKVQIPYRNGDLLIDTGVYENYYITYTIGVTDPSRLRNIADWLLNTAGYQRLTDSYNADEYRMASYYNDLSYQMTRLYRYGQATITFDAKPQRYLVSGETAVQFSADGTITNPTGYASQPYLEVYGDGTFTVNGYEITVINNAGDEIDIDCERMQCSRPAEDAPENMNANVSMPNGWPKLSAGQNSIIYDDDLEDSLYITPRWWRL